MQAKVFISGFVQGVGFRQSVKRKAQELGLTGWVKNLLDGRVEVLFEGSKNEIEEAISFCRNGPFLSEVKNVNVEWVKKDKKEFLDFDIL